MIRLDAIAVSFGQRAVLHGASLHVESGETVAVIGQSGVGKTTLLHVAAGLVKPSAGSAAVGGMSAEAFLATGRLGYLFQRPALFPWMTVREYVAQPLQLGVLATSFDRQAVDAAVERALSLAHISDAADLLPHQLSGGMRARAALAAALVREPSVILLDEPFGALDDITRERVTIDVAVLLAERTSLLVTHNLNEALLLADRVVVMSMTSAGAVLRTEVSLSERKPRTAEFLASTEAVSAAKVLRAALADAAMPSDRQGALAVEGAS